MAKVGSSGLTAMRDLFAIAPEWSCCRWITSMLHSIRTTACRHGVVVAVNRAFSPVDCTQRNKLLLLNKQVVQTVQMRRSKICGSALEPGKRAVGHL